MRELLKELVIGGYHADDADGVRNFSRSLSNINEKPVTLSGSQQDVPNAKPGIEACLREELKQIES